MHRVRNRYPEPALRLLVFSYLSGSFTHACHILHEVFTTFKSHHRFEDLAFAGIALFFPVFKYYQKIPGEANDLVMPVLVCVALIIPGAIFDSIASTKKKQAGIGC